MQLQHTYDKMHDTCIYLDMYVTNLCRKPIFNMVILVVYYSFSVLRRGGGRRATVPPMPKDAVHSAICSSFDINITCKNN